MKSLTGGRSERCNEQESMQGSAAAAKVPQTQIQVLEVKGIHVKGSEYWILHHHPQVASSWKLLGSRFKVREKALALSLVACLYLSP